MGLKTHIDMTEVLVEHCIFFQRQAYQYSIKIVVIVVVVIV